MLKFEATDGAVIAMTYESAAKLGRNLRRSLVVSTALASALLVSPTAAIAGSCEAGVTTYDCSGAGDISADITQTLTLTAPFVSAETLAGFGIDTRRDLSMDAIDIIGSGTFLDANQSTIVGGHKGIDAYNNSDGALTITTSGLVRGVTSDGISVSSQLRYEMYGNEIDGYSSYRVGGGGDVTVNANNVTGAANGIRVDQSGYGSTTVTATGLVEGTAGRGVSVVTGAHGGATTVEVNDVNGGTGGISVDSQGYGPISVTSHGAVTALGGSGVEVYGGANTNGLTITTDGAVVGDIGISANLGGTGNLAITATGQVTGQDGDGIYASGGSDTGDLTITAAGVTGTDNGLLVSHYGSGALSITTTGTVSGDDYNGIDVSTGTGTTSVTVNTAAVSGYGTGIRAYNNGSGALSITASGTVTSASSEGKGYVGGIVAVNRSAYVAPSYDIAAPLGVPVEATPPTDLIINAADVTGAGFGIFANNGGTGITSITTTGAVSGANGDGILAIGGSQSQGLTITAVSASGSTNGIQAIHNGTGALTVTATGAVSGTNYDGIFVAGQAGTTSVTVNSGAVTGGYNGINASNRGTGALTITATGPVTSTSISEGGISGGIVAFNQSSMLTLALPYGEAPVVSGPTDLIINAADVMGAGYGIYAANYGSGITSVTASGTVTGAAGEGIYVYGGANSKDLTVSAKAVTGSYNGIDARHYGTGALSITSTGPVVGTEYDGILALTGSQTSQLTINSAAVTGSDHGIYASNLGTGALTITASGDVTATGTGYTRYGGLHSGITAYNGRPYHYGYYERSGRTNAGTDLTIVARNVAGDNNGIYAYNLGSGKTSITTTGLVAGANGSGISVYGGYNSTDLTIIADDVAGAVGIDAFNAGTGKTAITTTGAVTGTAAFGIRAHTAYSSTGLAITTGAVSAAQGYGISAGHEGSGDLVITANGPVTVADGSGIVAYAGRQTESLTITATDVSATALRPSHRFSGTAGIAAINGGVGSLTITSTGTVSATDAAVVANPSFSQYPYAPSPRSVGIFAVNGGRYMGYDARPLTLESYFPEVTATDLTITANNVSGDLSGVVALNYGTGTTTVTTTGTVNGGAAEGIRVRNNYYATGDLSVTANNVTGGTSAINALNVGTGALSITTNGVVTGQSGNGVSAYNAGGGQTTVAVHAGSAVTGTNAGVNVYSATPVTITNAGLIANASGSAEDLAIQVSPMAAPVPTLLADTAAPIAVSTTLVNTGTITGVVNFAPAANTVSLLGGAVNGTINMGDAGGNTVTFSGGTLSGGINLGAGDNNSATLSNLTAANFVGPVHISSGSGENNVLTLDNVTYKGGSFAVDDAALGLNVGVGFTTIALTNGTNFTLTGPLTFAHSTLDIGAGTTLTVAPGGQTISSTGGAATVVNAGTIDLIGAGSTASNMLTVFGNYTGSGGRLLVGANATSADMLIIDGTNGGGVVDGTTTVFVTDLSGLGGATSGDGIKVVDAINGATITAGSFRLSQRVQAGARDYGLFQGGVTDAANPDFFLRASGFRPEVYVDAVIPAMAHQMGRSFIGTLDDRLEGTYRGTGRSGMFWGRAFGEKGGVRQKASRSSGTGYNYSNGGMIVGIDVVGNGTQSGSRDLLGPYFGYGRITADLRQGVVGHDALDAFVLGGYWTHFGSSGWYTNLQAQVVSLSGSAQAGSGIKINANGTGYAVSFEAGKPLVLSEGLKLIPQVQVDYQGVHFGQRNDGFALVDHHDGGTLTARAGLKLEKSTTPDSAGQVSKFWLRGDVLSGFNGATYTDVSNLSGADTVSFKQKTGNTWGRVGGGFSFSVSSKATVFGSANYNQQLDHTGGNSVSGVIGLNIVM